MRKRGAIWLFMPAAVLMPVAVFMGACRETYIAPAVSGHTGYLVVEGFINNGEDSTLIELSRSFRLDSGSSLQPELQAEVDVEGKDNSSYPLPEIGNGQYGVAALALNNAVPYRLHIRTGAGREYVSDYVDLKGSPPIDSIGWTNSNAGLQIYVNTHDPQNATHYYRWEYQETWEFRSDYYTGYGYSDHNLVGVVPDTFYTCWNTVNSENILVGSSARLSTDLIAQFPLVLIPPNSRMISIEYSILVKQYPLSQEAYAFWSELQQNTEELGSIFSPEPFQTKGNLHAVGDSSETVIGYVGAGTLQQKRIYLTPDQIPGWSFNPFGDGCSLLKIPDSPESLESYLGGLAYLPVALGNGVVFVAFATCVNCTLTGTNKKPSFWP